MDKHLLNDPKEFPDEKVLEKYLGKTKNVWDKFLQDISAQEGSLDLAWKYYRDGNAWLCKLTKKKMTVCWISIWDKYFKVTFYFNEKCDHDIQQMEIGSDLKESYAKNKSIGKLKPLTVEVRTTAALKSVATLIKYKSSIK